MDTILSLLIFTVIAPAIDSQKCKVPTCDAVILVDGTSAVGATNFQKLKDYLRSFIQRFTISLAATHVGLVQFTPMVRPEFYFKHFSTDTQVDQAVASMPYVPCESWVNCYGTDDLNASLPYAAELALTEGAGNRPEIPDVIIVLTTGHQNTKSNTSVLNVVKPLSPRLIYVVEVGDVPQFTRLPGADVIQTFHVNDFDHIAETEDGLCVSVRGGVAGIVTGSAEGANSGSISGSGNSNGNGSNGSTGNNGANVPTKGQGQGENTSSVNGLGNSGTGNGTNANGSTGGNGSGTGASQNGTVIDGNSNGSGGARGVGNGGSQNGNGAGDSGDNKNGTGSNGNTHNGNGVGTENGSSGGGSGTKVDGGNGAGGANGSNGSTGGNAAGGDSTGIHASGNEAGGASGSGTNSTKAGSGAAEGGSHSTNVGIGAENGGGTGGSSGSGAGKDNYSGSSSSNSNSGSNSGDGNGESGTGAVGSGNNVGSNGAGGSSNAKNSTTAPVVATATVGGTLLGILILLNVLALIAFFILAYCLYRKREENKLLLTRIRDIRMAHEQEQNAKRNTLTKGVQAVRGNTAGGTSLNNVRLMNGNGGENTDYYRAPNDRQRLLDERWSNIGNRNGDRNFIGGPAFARKDGQILDLVNAPPGAYWLPPQDMPYQTIQLSNQQPQLPGAMSAIGVGGQRLANGGLGQGTNNSGVTEFIGAGSADPGAAGASSDDHGAARADKSEDRKSRNGGVRGRFRRKRSDETDFSRSLDSAAERDGRANSDPIVVTGRFGRKGGTRPARRLVPPPPPLPHVDLLFVIDNSGSIGNGNFDRVKSFLKSVAERIEVSAEGSRIGCVMFNQEPLLIFGFDKYLSTPYVLGALDRLTYMGGGTYSGRALRFAAEVFKTPQASPSKRTPRGQQPQSNSDLPPRLSVLVFVSDGVTEDHIEEESENLRLSGVQLAAVSVKEHQQDMLLLVTRDPDSIFSLDDHARVVEWIETRRRALRVFETGKQADLE